MASSVARLGSQSTRAGVLLSQHSSERCTNERLRLSAHFDVADRAPLCHRLRLKHASHGSQHREAIAGRITCVATEASPNMDLNVLEEPKVRPVRRKRSATPSLSMHVCSRAHNLFEGQG